MGLTMRCPRSILTKKERKFFVRRFFVQFLPRNNIRHIKKIFEAFKICGIKIHMDKNDVMAEISVDNCEIFQNSNFGKMSINFQKRTQNFQKIYPNSNFFLIWNIGKSWNFLAQTGSSSANNGKVTGTLYTIFRP